MKQVRYALNEYMLLKVQDGFVVVNNRGAYKNHHHIDSYSSGVNFIHLMADKIIPKDRKTAKSILRVTTDTQYISELKKAMHTKRKRKR